MGISVGMAEQYSEREISQMFDELITAWWDLTTTRSLLSDPPIAGVLPPGAPLEMPLAGASELMDVVPLMESVQKLEEEYAAAASRVKTILPEGSSVVHDYRNSADAERAGKYTIRHQAGQLQVERANT